MSLLRSLRLLQRKLPPAPLPARDRAACHTSSRAPRSSCTPREPRPCPPCKPFPRPPCRSRGPEPQFAIQVTCCPPPRGHPPPCKPVLPACALNCSHAKPLEPKTRYWTNIQCGDEKCGELRDQVVERHEAARAARREEYLREAAGRRASPPPRRRPAPAAPCDQSPLHLKFPSCPPPPEPTACGICAPIDKSQFRDPSGTISLEPEVPSERSSSCKPPAAGAGGARYAGDSGWCGMPAPRAPPQRCRPPSARERLRRRAPCRDLPCLADTHTASKKQT